MKKIAFSFCALACFMISSAQKFEFVEKKTEKRIDVLCNGKLITAYRYDDSIQKPFLFPVNTLNGVTVTRGWPLDPRAGERTDHPHHTGIWMNYESLNGLDFWNNSTAIAPGKRHLYGTIRHDSVIELSPGNETAVLQSTSQWLHPDGHKLLEEKTLYRFGVIDGSLFILRTSTLTALNEKLVFKDVKDGFFAIRVARELEMPSTQADVFTDVHGNKTDVPKMINNKGITGNYISSEGKMGDSVWGTKARWTMLQGKKDGKDITIGIVDHPSNVGYPSYWHARGYGLFAINPFGRKIFSNGKEELNFTLAPNTSVTFRYGMILAEKKLSEKDMNGYADRFEKSK